MQGRISKEGKYELFETSKGHQILNLLGQGYFAVVEGQKGDILVASDSDHQKKKTLAKGQFVLADFDGDSEFRDMPHLFLQHGKQAYKEWILPRGVPSAKDKQKKLVRADTKVGAGKLKSHLGGAGAERSSGSSAGSDFDELMSKSKSELYQMARKRQVSGRSKMNKEALARELS